MPPVPEGYRSKLPTQKPATQVTFSYADDDDAPQIIQPSLKPLPPKPVLATGERLIHIIRWSGGTATVKAKCLQWVGIHKTLPGDYEDTTHEYAVTHIKTQLMLFSAKMEEEATKIARSLEDHMSGAMKQVKSYDVIKNLPPWSKEWIREVRKQGKWVDPVPFKKMSTRSKE